MVADQIKSAFPKLRKSEKKAALYMLEHSDDMDSISLEKVAKEAQVSQATIFRMLKAAGYKSFKELKIAFIEEKMKNTNAGNDEVFGMIIDESDDIEDVPGKVIHNIIGLLEDSINSISAKSLKKAVKAIENAEHVCIFSVENSNSVSLDLQTKLMYLGINCEFCADYYLQSIRAGHMGKNDVAIGISYSGTSINTVDVLKEAKQNGATTIAITNYTDTPLVKYADIVILTSDKQFFYGNDIFSRTIHLAVVDMIYMGLLVDNRSKYMDELHNSGEMVKQRKY